MDFGFHFGLYGTVHEDVALAEELGFSHAWLYDTQMIYGDVYAGLCVCATRTKKIKLGPGVTNPRSRIFPTTASGIATVNLFAPGRAVLGIGTGNSTRRAMGFAAVKLAELRECVEVCRGLLRGERVRYREGDRERMIQFLNPPGSLNIRDPIPIYISATGPKALELAGEIGDGVILWGLTDEALIDYHLRYVRRGAERAGRNFDDLYVVCMTAHHFTAPGESLDSLRQATGHLAVSSFNLMALSCRDDPDVLPAKFRRAIMACKDAFRQPGASVETRHLDPYRDYVASLRSEHAALATEEAIKATTITGTPEECLETIRRMERAGIHQVAIQPGTVAQAETLKTFAAKIVERY
jgi:5,10-methylenetetrahydromethanopterin reductase